MDGIGAPAVKMPALLHVLSCSIRHSPAFALGGIGAFRQLLQWTELIVQVPIRIEWNGACSKQLQWYLSSS